MYVQLVPEGYLQLFHLLHANRVRNSVNDTYDQQLNVHYSERKKEYGPQDLWVCEDVSERKVLAVHVSVNDFGSLIPSAS